MESPDSSSTGKEPIDSRSLALLIAKATSSAALRSDNSIFEALIRAEAISAAISYRQMFELIVIGLFPFDLMLSMDHGDRAYEARHQARQLLLSGLDAIRAETGEQLDSDAPSMQSLEDRLQEYNHALQAESGPGPEGLKRFSLAAAARFVGSAEIDPAVFMLIGASFTATWKSYRPYLRSLDILG